MLFLMVNISWYESKAKSKCNTCSYIRLSVFVLKLRFEGRKPKRVLHIFLMLIDNG